jgi:hypothetical protein
MRGTGLDYFRSGQRGRASPGGKQTWGEALANEPSLRKPADRGEAIANHRMSATDDIGNYGNGAGRQTTGRNRWVSVPRDEECALEPRQYA